MAEIIQSMFSDHNGMKQETNFKKRARKPTNMWILSKERGEKTQTKSAIKEGEVQRTPQKHKGLHKNTRKACMTPSSIA